MRYAAWLYRIPNSACRMKGKDLPSITLKQCLQLSKKYNVIPVSKDTLADLETPLSAYLKIDDPEYSFLLESVEGGERAARYSFLGRAPFETFSYSQGKAIINLKGKTKIVETNDPYAELQKIFSAFRTAPIPGLPAFRGGAVGYVGYDTVKLYEKTGDLPKKDTLGWPDMFFMFADVLMIFDHVGHKIQVVCNVMVEEGDSAKKIKAKYEKAVSKLDYIINDLKKPLRKKAFKKHTGPLKIKHLMEKKEYERIVRETVALINNGEAIQVVLSQRFGVDYNGDPLNVYRALRTVNPSPYMHFIRMGEKAIVGASPELMVKVESGIITLRPIAGTAKRGRTPEEDAKTAEALLKDEKERAEHVMLVDLGRNDIGRVAETGTVKVRDMMMIEKYSHVMHIVSSVEGKIKKGLNIFDVFKATFPAGTVSGAPKVRAMQIIDEMETIKRGPYAGAVGFISFTGDLMTCISIRTLYYDNGTFYAQAGAGIVADSKPKKEYNESMNKAKAVFRAIEKSVEI